MKDKGEDALKAALEPPQAAVERVVGAALAARHYDGRRRTPWLALVAALLLIAMVLTYARRERPLTEPLPVAPELDEMTKVSNVGTVMLVEGTSLRTLVASTGKTKEPAHPAHSYRIIISKGTVP